MREQWASAALTVYFDGQFWVGVAERRDERGLSACRIVFGAEPSDAEVSERVLRPWPDLPFSPPLAEPAENPIKLAANPKRRKREAAAALQATAGGSTKAQQALAAEHERAKDESAAARTQHHREEDDRRFAERTAKRKRRRRGK